MRAALWAAYAVYLAVAGWLVWSPGAEGASAVVGLLADLGLDPVLVERALNVALFVPMSLLGAWVLGRWGVVRWTAAGLAVSLVVEGVQLLLIPTRSATLSDLVANTLGALLGAMLADVTRSLSRRAPARPRAAPPR